MTTAPLDAFYRAINTLQVCRPAPSTLNHQIIRPRPSPTPTPACPQARSSIIPFWLGKQLALLSQCTSHGRTTSDVRVYLLLNLLYNPSEGHRLSSLVNTLSHTAIFLFSDALTDQDGIGISGIDSLIRVCTRSMRPASACTVRHRPHHRPRDFPMAGPPPTSIDQIGGMQRSKSESGGDPTLDNHPNKPETL